MAARSQSAMMLALTAVAAGVALLALRRRRTMRRTDQLAARSCGCLLGAAVGDALGAGCEMMTADSIAKVYGRVTAYIPEAEQKFGGGLKRVPGCYTDDTEMAIGLALSLVATRGDVDTVHIAEQHAQLYSPWRGYGRGTTKVLEALVSGTASPLICGLELTRPSYEPKATWQGSKSNGGAMRIHPLGVLAATVGASPEVVRRATTAALLPTHTHPEAIDAAFCQALAVARLCRVEVSSFRVLPLLEELSSWAQTRGMQAKLQTLRDGLAAGRAEADLVDSIEDGLIGLDGVTGIEAVACALCCVAFHAHEPAEGIITAVGYGGDCDTIAGMAGALLGALHGDPEAWMPPAWIADLEPTGHGGYSASELARVASALVDVRRLEAT